MREVNDSKAIFACVFIYVHSFKQLALQTCFRNTDLQLTFFQPLYIHVLPSKHSVFFISHWKCVYILSSLEGTLESQRHVTAWELCGKYSVPILKATQSIQEVMADTCRPKVWRLVDKFISIILSLILPCSPGKPLIGRRERYSINKRLK